jgi:hypothetical protein
VSRESDRPGAPNVAIVAVHGVGNQAAGTTATAIADLLANLETPGGRGGPLYTPFVGRELRVPVRRLEVPAHVPTGKSFAERAETLRVKPDRAPIDVEFTRSLLVDYQIAGPEDTYETVLLGGTRQGGADTPSINVDVYEMYWADLSRLTQSAFSVLADTYQLLFHLGSLGVHTISAAQASEPAVGSSALWSWWARAQRVSADAIALGAALANLLLVGLAILLVGSALIPRQSLVAVLLGGLIVVVVAGRLAYLYRWTRALWLLALTATALLAVWSVVHWGAILLPPDDIGGRLLITELWLLTSVAFALVVRLYSRYRPGAGMVGAIFGLTVSLRLLPLTWSQVGPMGAVLDAGALGCVALGGSWILFFLTGWAAFLLGRWVVVSTWLAHRRTPSPALAERLDRVGRSDWTARLTAAIPAALFVLATTIFWGAAWQTTSARIVGCVPGTAIVGAFEHLLVQDVSSPPSQCDQVDPAQIVRSVINTAAAWGFGALMSLVALAALVGLVALMPSALDEIRPPKGACDGRRLGQWLDAGLRHCRVSGYLLWFGVLVVLPVGFLVVTFGTAVAPDGVQVWADLNTALLTIIVGALAPVAAGVMTFGRRLKALAPGIRTVVDAALDVDNHLREHPRDAAPRARIAARYASVLRRLYASGYEKIIIVSHSQGTAITTDLLRYITYESKGPDAALVSDSCARDACPLVLLTMGSPLRQLYGLRFPYLYGWARNRVTGPCAPGATLPETAAPDPAPLGLSRWGNLYRSGDYVGRSLWRPDGCEPLNAVTNAPIPQPWPLDAAWPQAFSTDERQTRFEVCLGAGAHTHYWDETAPSVAQVLDRLITTPAADLPRPAPTAGAADEARARQAR